MATCLLLLLLFADGTASLHGTLPRGSHLELLLQGSPDRKTAEPDAKGNYTLEVASGRYLLALVSASGKRSESYVWLAGAVTINAEPESKTATTGEQYDLLADWRVTPGGPAKVSLDAELTDGRFEKLPAWAALSVEDETEKEVDGPLNTSPDGRLLFRVRESRIRPERVVAIRVTAVAPGHATTVVRLTPVLEFSSSGHLHAVYPEQEFVISLK